MSLFSHKPPKTVVISVISVIIFGLPLVSFFPSYLPSALRDVISFFCIPYLVFNFLLSLGLLASSVLTDWRKKDNPANMQELTSTWVEASAFVAIVLFSVVFPVVVLIFESITHVCSDNFMNLMPSGAHIALLVFGPLVNAFCIVQLFTKWKFNPKQLSFLNGIAIGISIPFAVVSLGLIHMAILAFTVGAGWIPIAAILAFVATTKLSYLMSVFQPDLRNQRKNHNLGILVGLALFVLAQAQVMLTSHLVSNAAEHMSDQSVLDLLRVCGDKKHMLRLCYEFRNIRAISDFCLPEVNHQDAQKVFLKVMGKSYKEYPKPDTVIQDERRKDD